jgi:hypothetical protein
MFPAYPMAENVSIGPVPDEFDNEIFYPPPRIFKIAIYQLITKIKTKIWEQ